MIERTLLYPAADRELYLQGKMYSQWKKKRKYGQSTLFLEIDNDPSNKQFPISSPPLAGARYGFGELFAGMHYLDRGFRDVIRYHYYPIPGYDSYEKALKILGPKAAKFICRSHPQPPDLLVFDKKDRFLLVEVKLPGDDLNPNQIAFFHKIESYLNRNMPQSKKARHRLKRHWIVLLKLKPEVVIPIPSNSIRRF